MRTLHTPLTAAAITVSGVLMAGAVSVLAHRIGGMGRDLRRYRESREYAHGLVVGWRSRGDHDSQ